MKVYMKNKIIEKRSIYEKKKSKKIKFKSLGKKGKKKNGIK